MSIEWKTTNDWIWFAEIGKCYCSISDRMDTSFLVSVDYCGEDFAEISVGTLERAKQAAELMAGFLSKD